MPVGTVRPIEDLDVPLPVLERQIAEEQVKASVRRLQRLLAHPDDRPKTPAEPGELAEYSHLLHDADPDATTPAFPDLTKPKRQEAS
jgi:hypothetical protein